MTTEELKVKVDSLKAIIQTHLDNFKRETGLTPIIDCHVQKVLGDGCAPNKYLDTIVSVSIEI